MKISSVGAMRERVVIQSQIHTVDDAGDGATSWETIATVWARVTPTSAKQVALAGRDDTTLKYAITIRYRADVTTRTRIIWRDRILIVTGVTDVTEQRVFLEVMAEE